MEGEDILRSLKEEAAELRDKNTQLNTALSSSAYQGQEDPNVIQFQVDTGEMLGKIEHFLRGEYIAVDKDGNEHWSKPMKVIKLRNKKTGKIREKKVVDNDLILFNDYGVNSIMAIIGNYIDKNTILSWYDEMRINEILADLGDEMANFIYCNYEKMGMDTEFKKTRFSLIVINILHIIESAYRRALRGKTMEDINSARIFTQSSSGRSQTHGSNKKNFNLFKPSTW